MSHPIFEDPGALWDVLAELKARVEAQMPDAVVHVGSTGIDVIRSTSVARVVGILPESEDADVLETGSGYTDRVRVTVRVWYRSPDRDERLRGLIESRKGLRAVFNAARIDAFGGLAALVDPGGIVYGTSHRGDSFIAAVFGRLDVEIDE